MRERPHRPPTDPILGVIPADPWLRRVALVAWIAIGVVGALGVWYVTSVIERAEALATHDARGAFLEVQRVTIPMMIGFALAGVGVGVYLLLTAVRVVRSGRFPPPGARVLRPTPIRSGPAAQRLGILLVILAVLITGASVAVPVFMRRVVQAVEQTNDRVRAVPP